MHQFIIRNNHTIPNKDMFSMGFFCSVYKLYNFLSSSLHKQCLYSFRLINMYFLIIICKMEIRKIYTSVQFHHTVHLSLFHQRIFYVRYCLLFHMSLTVHMFNYLSNIVSTKVTFSVLYLKCGLNMRCSR